MKKAFLSVFAAVLVLSLGTAAAFAAEFGSGRNFTDADGDGVCDRVNGMCVYADADGDGVCNVCGADHRKCLTEDGKNFVDANGDGVCDNCGDCHWCSGTGTGCCGNFTDANGDGICDNYKPGQGQGNGRGGGGGHGCGSQGGCGNGFRGGRGR